MTQPTTNRRDLLRLATTAAAYTVGAAIVTGGVAVVSVAATLKASSAAWDAAMRTLAMAQAASDDCDRTHIVLPANFDQLVGAERRAAVQRISAGAWEGSEPFMNAIADAESDLMGMPAPHPQALLWKLEKLLEINDDSTTSWSANYAAQTLADMRRLLAGGHEHERHPIHPAAQGGEPSQRGRPADRCSAEDRQPPLCGAAASEESHAR